jgi:hypothetical protein
MRRPLPRYTTSLEIPRPPGARLLEAFSPKLGRRMRLFDHASFELWIALEADPTVVSLCERPTRLATGAVVDFWAQRHDGEALLLLEHGEFVAPLVGERGGDMVLRMISAAELAAARTWTGNWQRMLPVTNGTRSESTRSLARAVLDCVREPVTLGCVEQQLATGDPSVIRGTIFELLRTGRLNAPSLHTRPLSLQTLLEPAR